MHLHIGRWCLAAVLTPANQRRCTMSGAIHHRDNYDRVLANIDEAEHDHKITSNQASGLRQTVEGDVKKESIQVDGIGGGSSGAKVKGITNAQTHDADNRLENAKNDPSYNPQNIRV
jgi:hypothetical protein